MKASLVLMGRGLDGTFSEGLQLTCVDEGRVVRGTLIINTWPETLQLGRHQNIGLDIPAARGCDHLAQA